MARSGFAFPLLCTRTVKLIYAVEIQSIKTICTSLGTLSGLCYERIERGPSFRNSAIKALSRGS